MKNLLTFILCLLSVTVFGQYRPNSYTTNRESVVDSHVLNLVGGGPTNGITSSVATNIAAYQAFLATNGLAKTVSSGFTGTNVTVKDHFWVMHPSSGSEATFQIDALGNLQIAPDTGTLFVGNVVSDSAFVGSGSALTNLVGGIAAGSNITITTNANNRLLTIASTASGTSGALTNNEARAVTFANTVSGTNFIGRVATLLPNGGDDTTAINAALIRGGTVILGSGTFNLTNTLKIPSYTILTGSGDTVLKKNAVFSHVICNTGAYASGSNDTQIVVQNLTFDCGANDTQTGSAHGTANGQIQFSYGSDMTIKNIRMTGTGPTLYGIHLQGMTNVLVNQFTCTLMKDGIKIGPGCSTIEVSEADMTTGDDAITLCPIDYPRVQDTANDIEYITLRNMRLAAYPATAGGAFKFYIGSWANWTNGNRYNVGELANNAGKIYKAVNQITNVVAANAPTHSTGDVTGADGITWRFLQTGTKTTANISHVRVDNLKGYSNFICHPNTPGFNFSVTTNSIGAGTLTDFIWTEQGGSFPYRFTADGLPGSMVDFTERTLAGETKLQLSTTYYTNLWMQLNTNWVSEYVWSYLQDAVVQQTLKVDGAAKFLGSVNAANYVGKINSGEVTNAAGSRVAYLTDVVGGNATNVNDVETTTSGIIITTNALLRSFNLNPALAALRTNNGAGLTNVPLAGVTGYGTAAYSNATAFAVLGSASNHFTGDVGFVGTTIGFGSGLRLMDDGGGSANINSPFGAQSFTGGGSGVTNLNASNLAIGQVADARMTNAAKLNGTNIFTANNSFLAASNYFTGTLHAAGAVRMDDASLLATNVTFYTNASGGNALTLYGNLSSKGMIVSTNFTSPTNAAVDTYVLTATGTSGATKWAVGTGGTGQSNNVVLAPGANVTVVTNTAVPGTTLYTVASTATGGTNTYAGPWNTNGAGIVGIPNITAGGDPAPWVNQGYWETTNILSILPGGLLVLPNYDAYDYAQIVSPSQRFTLGMGNASSNYYFLKADAQLSPKRVFIHPDYVFEPQGGIISTNGSATFGTSYFASASGNGVGLTNLSVTNLIAGQTLPIMNGVNLTNVPFSIWPNWSSNPNSYSNLAGLAFSPGYGMTSTWTYTNYPGIGWVGIRVNAADTNQFITTNGGTFYGAIYSGSYSAANAPATTELPTAGWVRSLFNFGSKYYAGNVADTGATNTDQQNQQVFKFQSTIPTSFSRNYVTTDFLTNNGYIGAVVTTNAFLSLGGSIAVNAYIGFAGGSASPTLSLHPEIYWSYDKTNWYGDYPAGNLAVTYGATNLYQWAIEFPTLTSTNATGFYIQRRFKVGTVTGSGTRTAYFLVGTNAVSGVNDASHITMQSPTATAGNAYLAANQTFTGSNAFTGGLFASSAILGGTLSNSITGNAATASFVSGTLTNQFVYQTNAMTGAVLTLGQVGWTNLQASITVAGFSGVDMNREIHGMIVCTNSTASDLSVTFPAGVKITTNNPVVGQAIWCTNKSQTRIIFAVGFSSTNAAWVGAY